MAFLYTSDNTKCDDTQSNTILQKYVVDSSCLYVDQTHELHYSIPKIRPPSEIDVKFTDSISTNPSDVLNCAN